MTVTSLQQRRDLALGSGAELFYDEPVEIVRGDGCILYDRDGRRYLDLYNNVPCVGHGNRTVAEAMAKQQATLNVHSRYLHEGIVEYAERLADKHHDGIESLVFSCSGTEANEVALTMARDVTGARGIVCTDAAYHGNAGLVAALTGVGRAQRADSEIRGFAYPDCYRPIVEGADEATLCDAYLGDVAAAIADLKRNGHGFAAFIACSIFANEGLPQLPAGFMGAVADLVQREGGLMIADEVQSGFGRTGNWWGYETMGFLPDIVVMGKPMGNGLPLAATAASREHVNTFRQRQGYFNTFAASPLQAAVGMAVMDELERLDLVAKAGAVGRRLLAALKEREGNLAAIGEVRGCGLFISIELVEDVVTKVPNPALARRLANQLKDMGCLLSNAGAFDNVLKVRPPMVFTDTDAAVFLDAYDRCLGTAHD